MKRLFAALALMAIMTQQTAAQGPAGAVSAFERITTGPGSIVSGQGASVVCVTRGQHAPLWKAVFGEPGAWVDYAGVRFDATPQMVIVNGLSADGAVIGVSIGGRRVATVRLEPRPETASAIASVAVPPAAAGVVRLQLESGAAEINYIQFCAQMPLVQTKFTADPAPMVYNDTVFLYTTHDEDDAKGFKMRDWLLYTSTDMVNWQDRGAVASLKDFKWYGGDNGAWAEQVIERNGKFYMYCPIHGHGIAVLVADSPYGPFHDPIGKPLVWQKEHWYDIDPSVWIDDDGQAYMYWGNPNIYYVKLNKDMVSTSGDIVQLPRIEDYQEGPWIYKRDSHYYLAFASTCCPEGIGYAMSEKITGPWQYKGHIMNHTSKTRGNHPGIIDYKGRSYVLGLNYDVLRLATDEHSERRSVSAAEMHYRSDGTIGEMPYFRENELRQLAPFSPFRTVEAETMAWGYGLKTSESGSSPKKIVLCGIDDGESLTLRGVDFGKRGARRFAAQVASVAAGGTIEIRLDHAGGPCVGTLSVPVTGSHDTYVTASCKLKGAKGLHDLVFVFRGDARKELFRWDNWSME